MSVSNILDQNGVILSQFLPTAVTAPPVYGSFYFYNTTGNQTVAVGQGFNLPSTGSAVSPPAVSPSGAFVAGTPAETNLCTTTNSYYYTVAQPGVYSVSFTATVTPNSSTASTTNIVSSLPIVSIRPQRWSEALLR